MGAELFHADGQTDVTKLIFAFRNFAKTPKTLTCLKVLPITGFFIKGPNLSYIT